MAYQKYGQWYADGSEIQFPTEEEAVEYERSTEEDEPESSVVVTKEDKIHARIESLQEHLETTPNKQISCNKYTTISDTKCTCGGTMIMHHDRFLTFNRHFGIPTECTECGNTITVYILRSPVIDRKYHNILLW